MAVIENCSQGRPQATAAFRKLAEKNLDSSLVGRRQRWFCFQRCLDAAVSMPSLKPKYPST